MKNVNYILVNETDSKTATSAIRNCKLPDIGHHVIVEAGGFSDGFMVLGRAKRQSRAQGARFKDLVAELCHLRKHHPEAKILGISELGDYCVHPSERMNQIRRAMSDLP